MSAGVVVRAEVEDLEEDAISELAEKTDHEDEPEHSEEDVLRDEGRKSASMAGRRGGRRCAVEERFTVRIIPSRSAPEIRGPCAGIPT